MNFAAFPEICYRIYHCEKCGKVSIEEDLYYYRNSFVVDVFSGFNIFGVLLYPIKGITNWIIRKEKHHIKNVHIEHYNLICEKCLKIQDPKAIRSRRNPIDIYRNTKEEYRNIARNVFKKETEKFKKELPINVLKKLNIDAYLRLINPKNSVEEKKQCAMEYVDQTKKAIMEYLKSKTLENELVVKKKKEVMKREKEVKKFLRNFDDKINRYHQGELDCGKEMLTPDNYIFKKEGIKKKYRNYGKNVL